MSKLMCFCSECAYCLDEYSASLRNVKTIKENDNNNSTKKPTSNKRKKAFNNYQQAASKTFF